MFDPARMEHDGVPVSTLANGGPVTASAADAPNPAHPDRVTVARLRLLHDYVLVRPLAQPSKAVGSSIIIPETATGRERNSRGLVVAIGPGDYNQLGTAVLPMALQVGDLVYFGKYAGTDEEFEGQTLLVMRETEVRISVPAGRFGLVTHADPRLDHLIEDWCDVCDQPAEDEAKARLEADRDHLAEVRRLAQTEG